jgi:pectinesterase
MTSCGLVPVFLAGVLLAVESAAAVPDAVVATDGSGQYRSLQAAIMAAPARPLGEPRWHIRVKAGVYQERIYVQRERGHIRVTGDGIDRTVVTGRLHAGMAGADGKPIGTFRTATVQVDGDGMVWEDLTLANEAGPVGQALALRVDGDRVVFRRCRFRGWQDTILVNRGRHYFGDCAIEGHVDFIFGGATAYFERCRIHCLGNGYITAASTPEGHAYGLVFADCVITTEPGVKTYLGRPWRDFARTVFLRTEMDAGVRPEGWHNWNRVEAEKTVVYAEAGSRGPGGMMEGRVPWARRLSREEGARLTPGAVLGFEID